MIAQSIQGATRDRRTMESPTSASQSDYPRLVSPKLPETYPRLIKMTLVQIFVSYAIKDLMSALFFHT